MYMFESLTSLDLSPLLPTGTMPLPVPVSLREARKQERAKYYLRVHLRERRDLGVVGF